MLTTLRCRVKCSPDSIDFVVMNDSNFVLSILTLSPFVVVVAFVANDLYFDVSGLNTGHIITYIYMCMFLTSWMGVVVVFVLYVA